MWDSKSWRVRYLGVMILMLVALGSRRVPEYGERSLREVTASGEVTRRRCQDWFAPTGVSPTGPEAAGMGLRHCGNSGEACTCSRGSVAIYTREAELRRNSTYEARRLTRRSTATCGGEAFGGEATTNESGACYCFRPFPRAMAAWRSTACDDEARSGGRSLRGPTQVDKKRVALALFGINRSLNRTRASLETKIIAPLRARGVEVDIFFHTYTISTVQSRHANEWGVAVGGANEMIEVLSPRAWSITKQDEFDAGVNFSNYFRFPIDNKNKKAYKFLYYYPKETVRNLLRQLNSIKRVTALWTHAAKETPYTAVLVTRPDLLYLDPLDVDQVLQLKPNEVMLPFWHSYHGVNDRIQVAPPDLARQLGNRLDVAGAFSARQPLHAELLARYALDQSLGTPVPMAMRALRLRATGQFEKNDQCLTRCNILESTNCRAFCPGWQMNPSTIIPLKGMK